MTHMYRFVIVDVFTDVPLAGNQLAVFTNAVGLTDEQMQSLALELNFSETAFVLPPESGGDVRLRIFTPARELPFAGHPTLGAAFALAGPLQSVILRIETAAGLVPVALEREGARLVFGRMTQPTPTVSAFPEPEPLLEALGVERSLLPVERYDNGVQHLLVTLDTHAAVAALKPNMAKLARVVGEAGVSCFAADATQVKTRMFAPELGVGEDPATGSAAGPIAIHLARHGRIPWDVEIEISQGAEIGRPSTLYARAQGDADGATSVEVGGSAIVVARGEFAV